MSKLKVEDIQWSKHAYPLREAYKKCTFPAMFKVAQGYDSPDENESLARDQVCVMSWGHGVFRKVPLLDPRCIVLVSD